MAITQVTQVSKKDKNVTVKLVFAPSGSYIINNVIHTATAAELHAAGLAFATFFSKELKEILKVESDNLVQTQG